MECPAFREQYIRFLELVGEAFRFFEKGEGVMFFDPKIKSVDVEERETHEKSLAMIPLGEIEVGYPTSFNAPEVKVPIQNVLVVSRKLGDPTFGELVEKGKYKVITFDQFETLARNLLSEGLILYGEHDPLRSSSKSVNITGDGLEGEVKFTAKISQILETSAYQPVRSLRSDSLATSLRSDPLTSGSVIGSVVTKSRSKGA